MKGIHSTEQGESWELNDSQGRPRLRAVATDDGATLSFLTADGAESCTVGHSDSDNGHKGESGPFVRLRHASGHVTVDVTAGRIEVHDEEGLPRVAICSSRDGAEISLTGGRDEPGGAAEPMVCLGAAPEDKFSGLSVFDADGGTLEVGTATDERWRVNEDALRVWLPGRKVAS